MIAGWMLYSIAAGAFVYLLAWSVERLARSWSLPTRLVWLGASGVMVAVSAMALVRPLSIGDASDAPATAAANVANSERVEGGLPEGTIARMAGVRQRGARAITALGARLPRPGDGLRSWDRPLLGLWLAASSLLLAFAIYARVHGRRLARGLELRRVRGTDVLVTDRLGPATIGVRSPSILLPRWALELEAQLLDLVLNHEREHLRARDPVLLLLGSIAVILVPWHLPVWWAWRRLKLAVEVDCDARVLRARPDVRRYAELLLLTGQHGTVMPWPVRSAVAVIAPLTPHASHLARRIDIMTRRASRSITRSLLLIGAASLCATVALALPVPQRAQEATAQDPEIAGLYWMVPPNVPSTRMYAPAREFTYKRLAPDGRSRMENVTIDATGERVVPSVEITPWSKQKWYVIPATADKAPQLCWELGTRMVCSYYVRDSGSGDITMYSDSIGGKLELILRRAATS